MIPRWHKENIDTDISQLTSLIQEILIYVDRRQRADLIDDLPIFSLIQQRKSTLSTGGPISIVTRLSSRSIAFIDMVITTGWVDWCITAKLSLDFVANPFGRSTGFFLNLAHVFDHKVSTLNLWGVFTYLHIQSFREIHLLGRQHPFIPPMAQQLDQGPLVRQPMHGSWQYKQEGLYTTSG